MEDALFYLAQLVGHSIYQAADGQQGHRARLDTFLQALMFVLGFTLAFVALGATASTLGSFLRSYQILLRQVGGIILVLPCDAIYLPVLAPRKGTRWPFLPV
jgi:cytochrome c-type biogenesis protein